MLTVYLGRYSIKIFIPYFQINNIFFPTWPLNINFYFIGIICIYFVIYFKHMYTIYFAIISLLPNIKYFDVILDRKLTWNSHIIFKLQQWSEDSIILL